MANVQVTRRRSEEGECLTKPAVAHDLTSTSTSSYQQKRTKRVQIVAHAISEFERMMEPLILVLIEKQELLYEL